MHTHREQYAEYPNTEMNFARLRVILDIPGHPNSITTAMHIPQHMVDDFVREASARRFIASLFKDKPVDEFDLRQAQMTLHEAEDKARDTRQVLSHLVTRSLSDGYAKAVVG